MAFTSTTVNDIYKIRMINNHTAIQSQERLSQLTIPATAGIVFIDNTASYSEHKCVSV